MLGEQGQGIGIDDHGRTRGQRKQTGQKMVGIRAQSKTRPDYKR